MKFLTALLAALLGMSLGMSSQASALTAAEYQSLRQTWKLGYVVGIAHGRALYRKGDMAAGSREATLDDCIPKMSDVGRQHDDKKRRRKVEPVHPENRGKRV